MAREALEAARDQFREVFGREPESNDLMLLVQDAFSDKEIVDATVTAMRTAGVSEEFVYAYKRTRLMVSEVNEHLVPNSYMREWNDAIREFHREGGRSRYEVDTNRQCLDALYDRIEKSQFVLGSLLRREDNSIVCEGPEHVTFVRPFALFCLAKCTKTLKAIGLLLDEELAEDAIACVRGTYEAYLRLVYISSGDHNAEAFYSSTAGIWRGSHVHPEGKSGRRDYRVCVEIGTGRRFDSNVSASRMVSFSCFQEDIELHDALYERLSSFNHPDFRQTPGYFDGERFTALLRGERPEAVLLTVFASTLLLEKAATLIALDATARRDAQYCACKSRDAMVAFLRCCTTSTNESFFVALLRRIEKIGAV
jgi:hypothetical protein